MLIAIIVLLTALCLMVGGIIGWIISTFYNPTISQSPYLHPEMFDELGNIIPDQILAIRFENNYDNDNETEDED